MIRLESVTVRRGATTLVERLDLEIAAGCMFWIVGPNGAGKSTLLRVMALLDPPASGRVAHAPAPPRLLYFHPDMSLPAASTVRAWDRLVEEVLPAGGSLAPTALRPRLSGSRRVGRLSTGERKRLVLDALLRCPGPLLLDEPYEHLSPEAKTALTRILEARARTAVVVVASNQMLARAEQDRGLRLLDGAALPFGVAQPEARP